MDLKAITKIINIAKNLGLSDDEIEKLSQEAGSDIMKFYKLVMQHSKKKATSNIELQPVTGMVIALSSPRLTNKYDVERAKRTSDGKLYKVDETGSIVKDDKGNPIEVVPRYEMIGYAIIDDELHQLRIRCFENEDGKIGSNINIEVPGIYELYFPKRDDGKVPKIISVRDAKETNEVLDVTKIFDFVIDDISNAPTNDFAIYPMRFVKNQVVKTKDGREFERALFVIDSIDGPIWVSAMDSYNDFTNETGLVVGKMKMKETEDRTFYTILDPVEVKFERKLE